MKPVERSVRPVQAQGGVDVPPKGQTGLVGPPVSPEGHCGTRGSWPIDPEPMNMDRFVHGLVDWLVVLVPVVWVVGLWVTQVW